MNVALITLILFGSLFLLLATGLPIAFCLGGVAVIFTFLLWGPAALSLMASIAYENWTQPIFIAAILFLLIGSILQRSGIAEDMFRAIHLWLGRVRGGLAMGVVVICVIFAAIVGVSGVATVTMGLIAIPAMLNRGYNKQIALGTVAAGGALGILIPPSIIMILYCMVTGESVGDMFAGGILPGLLLASLFIAYIGVAGRFRPQWFPAYEEKVSWKDRLASLKSVVLPVLLILLILGSIYTGIATPSEAAAIGAFGALVCAAIYRKLNWQVISEACKETFFVGGMAAWVLLGAGAFNNLYRAMGAKSMVMNMVGGLELSPWLILISIQLIIFLMGFVIDDFAIVMILAPIAFPIIKALGFNTLWFGILFIVNMQAAYLTPPYGFNLFYLKAIVPKGITMGDIYRSIIPFVILQVIGLIIVMLFPQIATWLPSVLGK
ncbi:MAG: TRAP transporter large permease subunit [Chloroflexi bacterium]|nr:TRAP transporter large permease subunit [Chloroflexota bacterium]MBM4453702.1 TRAP transporter large permease subunit [Chloroflexota bacterium]